MARTVLPARQPTHPGAILREDVLPALRLSVTAFAKALGVSRQLLHGILAERHAVTPAMSVRLGAVLGNGAQLWIDMQTRHDLWTARRKLAALLPRLEREGAALSPA